MMTKQTFIQWYTNAVSKSVRISVTGGEHLAFGCVIGCWREDAPALRLMLGENAVASDGITVVELDSPNGPRRMPDMQALRQTFALGRKLVFLNFSYSKKVHSWRGGKLSLPLPFSKITVQARPISSLARSGDKRALAMAIHAI